MADEKRIREVFNEACELAGLERKSFLARACAGDTELRQRVERLLEGAEREDAFLSSPTAGLNIASASASSGEQSVTEEPGSTIGPYKLLQQVGQGGFGTVWMAEQQQPIARRVALKIIKLGMDTREVIARFEAERQALAVMNHANIAKVFDAGATVTGRPYFVMELVEGEPITSYCDGHKLAIHERLELFVQVCQAVQHAHTKGVIHRDIKPSNVLVGAQDGRPHAKVIDFGIAKATGAPLTERTLFTENKALIGTPEYMSPEQANGSIDIDTRSDVYSLGVLLYELLVGQPPFDSRSLRSAAYGEIQRIIREVEPPRPSTRLSQSSETIGAVALQRQVEPAKLGRLVRGELDWIVMKALEKDRKRRYETVGALALDVQRHLAGEAVVAAPPSTAYRIRKFVAHHKAAATAASLVSLALIVGMFGTSAGMVNANQQRRLAEQARASEVEQRKLAEENERRALEEAQRAERAAERARAAEADVKRHADELEQVSEFQAEMLRGIDANDAGARLMADLRDRFVDALAKAALPADQHSARVEAFDAELRQVNATDAATALIERTILQPALDAVEAQFKDQPLVDASLRNTLGEVYYALGHHDDALALHEQALETCRRTVGNEHEYTLKCQLGVGRVHLEQGNLAEAEPLVRHTLDTSRRVLGEEHRTTLIAINHVGELLRAQGKPDEAEPYLRESLEKSQHILGPDHDDTLTALLSLASLLKDQGRPGEAEPLFREALEKCRRLLGDEHPDTLTALNNFGVLLRARGDTSEAELHFREVLETSRRVNGEEHPRTLQAMNNFGSALHARRHRQAPPILRDALEKCRRVLGNDHPDTLVAVNNMAHLLQGQGKLAEAERLFQEALDTRRRTAGEEHPEALAALVNLGDVLKRQGRVSEAEPLLSDALEQCRRVLGDEHQYTLAATSHMGTLLLSQGRASEAEPYLQEALEKYTHLYGGDDPRTLAAVDHFAQALWQQDRKAEAESYCRQALETRRRVLGEDHRDTLKSVIGMGVVLSSQNRLEEAEPFMREAVEKSERVAGPEHPMTLVAMHNLVGLLRDQGQVVEAEQYCREVLEKRRRVLGEDHPDTLSSGTYLGVLLQDQRKLVEAETYLRRSVEGLEQKLGRQNPRAAETRVGLGRVLTDLGRFAEAERELMEANRAFAEVLGVASSERKKHAEACVSLYEQWHAVQPSQGHDASAARWRARLIEDAPNAGPSTQSRETDTDRPR